VRRRDASVVSAMNPQTGHTMLSTACMLGAQAAQAAQSERREKWFPRVGAWKIVSFPNQEVRPP
jgi:hypothetical protein